MTVKQILLVCVSLMLATLGTLSLSPRLTGIALLAATAALSFTYRLHRHRRWIVGTWIAALLVSFLPFDIYACNVPGPPRFVPYVVGLPSHEAMAAEKRGELVLKYSCLSTGFEPLWVWVW